MTEPTPDASPGPERATTPSQTAGPFVEIGMSWNAGSRPADSGETSSPASPIVISGKVFDGSGEPVTDAVVESWQADAGGRFASPGAGSGLPPGLARSLTIRDGRYELSTVKPGRVVIDSDRSVVEAPHVALSVFARGLLHRLVTYVYFDDETEANASDPLLSALEEPTRRRLTAVSGPDGFRFDIVLQGEEETPFFVP